MKKFFLTALLVAVMSTSTVFAAENFSATNAGLNFGTADGQQFVYHAGQRCEAKATFVSDLDARPGAVFVQKAKRFKSNIYLETSDGSRANAKSIMMLIAKGFRPGMEVTIIAEGADAQQAVDTLKEFIEAGCPER